MPPEGPSENSAEWQKTEKYDEEILRFQLNQSRESFVDTSGFEVRLHRGHALEATL